MSDLRPAAHAAAEAVDAALVTEDLVALVRVPSVTGDETAMAGILADRLEALGMTVEVFHPDPAAIREDPAWPGEEVPRTALPVVIGRAGRDGGLRRRLHAGVWAVRRLAHRQESGSDFEGSVAIEARQGLWRCTI